MLNFATEFGKALRIPFTYKTHLVIIKNNLVRF